MPDASLSETRGRRSPQQDTLPFFRTATGYGGGKLKADLAAGLTVGAVALPQSMAYAMIAGVNPKYGLYASIAPAIVSSVVGSSRFLISGPTNAISMLTYSFMTTAAVAGTTVMALPEEERIALIFLLGFMAGSIRLIMGLAHLGSLIHFISHSVVVGFSAGAGVLIGFNQLKNLLGLEISAHAHFINTVEDTFRHLDQGHLPSLVVGLSTIFFIFAARAVSHKLPGPLLAIVLSAAAVWALNLEAGGLKLLGDIPRSLPPLSVPPFRVSTVSAIFMPALAVAILGIVEAVSITKSLNNLSGDKTDPNREFIGLGLASIASAFFSAIPCGGSFTRSATNFAAGAATRFAGVFSGILVLLTLVLFAPLARFIPIASLAGILMVIAYSMIDKKGILLAFRATKPDRIVMATTLLSTLLLELQSAVFVGVFLSIALFLKRASHPQLAKVVPSEGHDRLVPFGKGDASCPQIVIYRIEGALFFGAIDELEQRLEAFDEGRRGENIIVTVKHVRCIDATGIHALERFLQACKRRGSKLIFVEPNELVFEAFRNSGLLGKLGKRNIVRSLSEAIHLACERYADPDVCRRCDEQVFYECLPLNGTAAVSEREGD